MAFAKFVEAASVAGLGIVSKLNASNGFGVLGRRLGNFSDFSCPTVRFLPPVLIPLCKDDGLGCSEANWGERSRASWPALQHEITKRRVFSFARNAELIETPNYRSVQE